MTETPMTEQIRVPSAGKVRLLQLAGRLTAEQSRRVSLGEAFMWLLDKADPQS